ncbi:hypothetical protein MMC28_011458 [Mycoblastus sanguinarius]|nr:hypothetical protein [Mycoblastus sanguinarius]
MFSAKNETVIHGWVPEPDGRGTWSILWSCLATIFIFTWSVLHLDVPEQHGHWYLLFRRVRWMLAVAIAPEVILAVSIHDYISARRCLGWVLANGSQDWTMTHMQFIYAGGLRLQIPAENRRLKCDLNTLMIHIEAREIIEPPVSRKELQSGSKSDWMTKLVALSQIT